MSATFRGLKGHSDVILINANKKGMGDEGQRMDQVKYSESEGLSVKSKFRQILWETVKICN